MKLYRYDDDVLVEVERCVHGLIDPHEIPIFGFIPPQTDTCPGAGLNGADTP